MPKSDKNSYQVDLPPELQKQLEEFRAKLWRIKLTEAILSGVIGWIVTALILFGLDRIWDTPPAVRLILFLVGMSVFAVFAPIWINRWVFKHKKEQQLASLISKKYPRLGDRLLGIVELRHQSESETSLSEGLRGAAMRTVARDVQGKNLTEALPHSWHGKAALALAGCLALAASLYFTYPEAAKNSMTRWLLPLSDTPRYTATKLDLSALPQPYPVPYGESFQLRIPLEKDSKDPGSAYARLSSQPWIRSETQDGTFIFELPAQQARNKIQLKAGDDVDSLTILPMLRPALESVFAHVKLPDYLERVDQKSQVRSGVISILKGSQFSLHSTSTNELKSASAQLLTQPEQKETQAEESLDNVDAVTPQTTRPLSVQTQGHKLQTKSLTMGEEYLDIALEWKDIHNLDGTAPREIRIEPISDELPSSYLSGVKNGHVMLAKDFTKITITSSDDYGIRNAGLAWQGSFDGPSAQTPSTGEKTFAQGSPKRTELKEEIDFSPIAYNIAPQKLELRAWAEDYNPSTERVYSKPTTIYVVTEEDHAQIQKRKFDDIINDLEDTFRREQTSLDETKRLDNLEAKDLQKEDNQKRIAEQEAKEQENTERMKQLNKRMEQLFQESMRNDLIDPETLKRMADSAQEMKELAEKDMPKVTEKFKDARDQRNAQEKTKQDIKESAQQQKKNVEKMQDIVKKANEANKNFEGSTFIARLRRAAADERNVANSTIRQINALIGLDTDQLDPAVERDLISIFRLQERTASDIRWIQEDLTHFYARTQKEEHKELLDKITESNITQGLEILQQEITQNHSYLTIDQAIHWSEQLEDWSKQLENAMQSGQGGGGGGQQNQNNQNFEFMLKVMKLIQQEQGIRAQTRALEQLHRDIQP